MLNIKRSVSLTIALNKIEISHKFLCVQTKLSLALSAMIYFAIKR